MTNALVIAAFASGGGMAMLGTVALIAAVVGLVYVARGRRRSGGRLDASEEMADEADRSPSASGHSLETSDRRPAA